MAKKKKETISSSIAYILIIVGIIEDTFLFMIGLFSLVPIVGWFGGPALLFLFYIAVVILNSIIVLANGIKKIPPFLPPFTVSWGGIIARVRIADEVYNKKNDLE